MSFWSFLVGAKPEPPRPAPPEYVPKFQLGMRVRHKLIPSIPMLVVRNSRDQMCWVRQVTSKNMKDWEATEELFYECELEAAPESPPDEKPDPEQPVKKSRPARKR